MTMIIVVLICKHLHIQLEVVFDCKKSKWLKASTVFIVKMYIFSMREN